MICERSDRKIATSEITSVNSSTRTAAPDAGCVLAAPGISDLKRLRQVRHCSAAQPHCPAGIRRRNAATGIGTKSWRTAPRIAAGSGTGSRPWADQRHRRAAGSMSGSPRCLRNPPCAGSSSAGRRLELSLCPRHSFGLPATSSHRHSSRTAEKSEAPRTTAPQGLRESCDNGSGFGTNAQRTPPLIRNPTREAAAGQQGFAMVVGAG